MARSSAARTHRAQMSKPTREELIQRARDLIPAVRARAVETENLRHLPPETLADFKAAGLHNVYTPARFGGHEMDWGAHVDISREIAKGCGSSGWNASVVLSHTWFLARFAPEAQEEVWNENPDAIIATAFARAEGETVPVEGGYRVSGLWRFSSGVVGADWTMLSAALPPGVVQSKEDKDAGMRFFLMVLVKPSEYEIVDNWHAAGLKGTGSHDVRMDNVFIPNHRAVISNDVMSRNPPGGMIHDKYIYHVEFFPYFTTFLLGPILGMAEGALADYLVITRERRGLAMPRGDIPADKLTVQGRVAESGAEIRAAGLLGREIVNYLHEYGVAGKPLVGERRAILGRDLSFASRLCVSAVERLASMMGATGQTDHNPVQRHLRDLRAAAAHGGLVWDNVGARWGKWALGLPTDSNLIDDYDDPAVV